MHPAGRTASFDRGRVVNHLEEIKSTGGRRSRVENALAPNFFPGQRDFHSLWSNNASLVWGDDFVLNAAPGDAAAEE